MADFSVYATYELQSALEPEAIWSRLQPQVEPLVGLRVTVPFATTLPYEGKRTSEGFVIKGLHHKSQYVTPLTHVRMEPTPEGTTLHVVVQRTGLSKPILPLVMLILAACIAGGAVAGGVPQVAVVAPFLTLGGFAMWGIASFRQASRLKQDRSFLESQVGA